MKRRVGDPIPRHLVPLLGNHKLLVHSAEVVEVGSVQRTLDNRLDRRIHRPQLLEVQTPEEGVAPDLVGDQTILRVANEAAEQVPRLLAHIGVRRYLEPPPPVHDAAGGHRGIVALIAEWRAPEEHLEHDDPQRPHVALLAVGGLPIHLRTHVVWRTNHGLHLLPRGVPRLPVGGRAGIRQRHPAGSCTLRRLRRLVLAKAKIQQVDVAVDVKEDVVRLDVTVNVVQVRVDVVDGLNQLRNVEPRLLLREGVLPHEVRHEIAARQVIHDHVEVGVILEGVV
mmetsp:Transcript_101175/g.241196  ORF Transcript_101175/g.241196 Transcript_101175/m.241196 type:complete len:281 (+) Transcript_101175:595-1437(+)